MRQAQRNCGGSPAECEQVHDRKERTARSWSGSICSTSTAVRNAHRERVRI